MKRGIFLKIGILCEFAFILFLFTYIILHYSFPPDSQSVVTDNVSSNSENAAGLQNSGTSITPEDPESGEGTGNSGSLEDATTGDSDSDYIKWVEFNISEQALEDAYKLDVNSQANEVRLNWVELLAYLGAKYGGDFKSYKQSDLTNFAQKLQNQETTIDAVSTDMKYYNYYYQAYDAVLGGLVGNYQIQTASDSNPDELVWVDKYGLKGFSPIAKGYSYSDYDDFGVSRSYGYRRNHLGHDMMGQIGTPIIAVESGYVEVMGWNQYGGWRIGIRSFDKKRYYYYAHLRQNFPFNKSLQEGSVVQAGDVIGYMGHTGYSSTENVNNIDQVHLHFGLELIFNECQKECNNEIWVDCYALTQFLYKNKCQTVKDPDTKEYSRVYQIIDPAAEQYRAENGLESATSPDVSTNGTSN